MPRYLWLLMLWPEHMCITCNTEFEINLFVVIYIYIYIYIYFIPNKLITAGESVANTNVISVDNKCRRVCMEEVIILALCDTQLCVASAKRTLALVPLQSVRGNIVKLSLAVIFFNYGTVQFSGAPDCRRGSWRSSKLHGRTSWCGPDDASD